jgi:Flp pilus assembly protein TadG
VRLWRRTLDRDGAAGIEFAAVGPLVLLLLWALLEVYRLLAAQRALDFAVTRGLRYASVNSTVASASTIATQVTDVVQSLLGTSTVNVTVTFTPAYTPGDAVRINATYTWTPLFSPADFVSTQLSSVGAVTVQN